MPSIRRILLDLLFQKRDRLFVRPFGLGRPADRADHGAEEMSEPAKASRKASSSGFSSISF